MNRDLSPTQRRLVIELALTGATDAELAARLGMGYSTVKLHLASARRRLGVRTRSELIVWAWRNELVRVGTRTDIAPNVGTGGIAASPTVSWSVSA